MATTLFTGDTEYFPEINKIPFEGKGSDNPLAFKFYDANKMIGGKSMGGRMASMIGDECAVQGLILLGYPFYAPKKQDKPRINHLLTIKTPTLILQGERDIMGSKDVVEKYPLSKNISIAWLSDGDHGLVPRKKSGLTAEDNFYVALKKIRTFLEKPAYEHRHLICGKQ